MSQSPLDRLERIVTALSAGQTCPAELVSETIELTGYTPEDLGTMSVAQILSQTASWLVLRTEKLDKLLAVAAGDDTAEKLQLLYRILVLLRDLPDKENMPNRYAELRTDYPYLQQATQEEIEKLTLYYEVQLPKKLR